jgi:hypothetical protein
MCWQRVKKWFKKNTSIFYPSAEPPQSFAKKCPEIPTLADYEVPPPLSFWSNFPHRQLPDLPSTMVNIDALQSIISEVELQMLPHQKNRASVLLYELEHGVKLPFSHKLPQIMVPNTTSAYEFGENFTDTVAVWVKKGFVAGPFVLPPAGQIFRLNSMIAVDQKTKIRIVMNLSGPKGVSFNDAIISNSLEKVVMSNARKFGYSLVDCGINARMWKFDMCDAYKNLPASPEDVLLQGFSWLGCLFFETQQPFGSKAAVAGFDRLGKTILDIARLKTGFPAHLVHRTIDDLPFVTPEHSVIGEEFSRIYQNICTDSGISIVTSCPKNEKAFENSKQGTVLGIRFDSTDLSWSISEKKRDSILSRIKPLLCDEKVSLHQVQKLVGSLNDFAQLCQVMRGLKHPILDFVTEFEDNDNIYLPVPQQVRTDLLFWASAVHDAVNGLPIPHRAPSVLDSDLTFVSDAAGAQFCKVEGRHIPFGEADGRGGASIGVLDGEIWFVCKVLWPEEFLFNLRDNRDHAYGCKTSTLEVIALILPFLCIPHLLCNKRITLLTDNESVVEGWDSRKIRKDIQASIFIRALHLISFYLGCHIHVNHLPRMSTEMAIVADALTRDSTTKPKIVDMISSANHFPPPSVICDWLRHPSDDWGFAFKLLEFVENMC